MQHKTPWMIYALGDDDLLDMSYKKLTSIKDIKKAKISA